MSMQSDFIASLKEAFKDLKKKTRTIPKEADDLKEVLARLKQREKDLSAKLERKAHSDDESRIKNEIKIIHHQLEKGLQLLKELNDGDEQPPL